MRITKENTSALFIDFQERLFPAMNEKETLLKNVKILLEGLNILGIPIAFSQQYTKGLGETIEELRSLVPDFAPIEKTDFSCFGVEEYTAFLQHHQSKTIILCGIEAHVCVLQTAVDLKEYGYFPIVVTDCINSRNAISKESAIDRFSYENIMTATCESILFELMRSAKAEEFRAISKLVK
ncbi:MAG: isochorismatase family protein [Bacteroidia bacterium]|nr:isochorismatase family protein [Bacteroidia bacterium]